MDINRDVFQSAGKIIKESYEETNFTQLTSDLVYKHKICFLTNDDLLIRLLDMAWQEQVTLKMVSNLGIPS